MWLSTKSLILRTAPLPPHRASGTSPPPTAISPGRSSTSSRQAGLRVLLTQGVGFWRGRSWDMGGGSRSSTSSRQVGLGFQVWEWGGTSRAFPLIWEATRGLSRSSYAEQ